MFSTPETSVHVLDKNRLQWVQNTAACLLSGVRRCDHITAVLRCLQSCLYGRQFQYRRLCVEKLCARVEDIRGHPWLRSTATAYIQLPIAQTSLGRRSFAFQGPTVWNSLPSATRDSGLSLDAFRRLLKTYLFGRWVSTDWWRLRGCLCVISAESINIWTELNWTVRLHGGENTPPSAEYDIDLIISPAAEKLP